ncbi:hypothetical protein B0H13DRAFT_2327602 [Mycena leptocephala]|nr:hypothetical protein B0H13DRAFT_2327602 [Mycena leptocephala]
MPTEYDEWLQKWDEMFQYTCQWLPVYPTYRNAVRGIEPATGPPDSELSAMADLRVLLGSDSLSDLLEKIYQHYDAGHTDALFRVSRELDEERAWRLKQILQHYEVPFFEGPLLSRIARNRACAAGKAGIRRISRACYRLGANIDVDKLARHDIGNAHLPPIYWHPLIMVQSSLLKW